MLPVMVLGPSDGSAVSSTTYGAVAWYLLLPVGASFRNIVNLLIPTERKVHFSCQGCRPVCP